MQLTQNRIAGLAKTIVTRLIGGSFIRVEGSPESLSEQLEKIIADEAMIEQRLNADVDKILESYKRDIDRGQVDYHQMFLMVKKKLAKERGIIL